MGRVSIGDLFGQIGHQFTLLYSYLQMDKVELRTYPKNKMPWKSVSVQDNHPTR
jgi:hypothetical protein